MAGASMNDIKARMKSVRSTMQITKAMELVATSKLRRAKERAERVRPYLELLLDAIRGVSGADGYSDSVFASPKSERTLIVAIAGDRGLAGGYNANVFRTVAALTEASGDFAIAPIGKKAKEYYSHRDIPIVDLGLNSVADVGVGDSMKAARTIADLIADGSFGRVVLVYTKFKSMISQVPVSEVLLPLEGDRTESASEPLLQEDPEEFTARVVPDYLAGAIFAAVCEAVASESGARRTAMNSANKNAEEMIDTLMLKFNRARQAVITQEITEIVSGAEAL